MQASVSDSLYRASPDHPLPPARLRFRVHGLADRQSFLQVGETCAGDLRNALRQAGVDFGSFTDILDFGCGCGRVMTFMRNPSIPQRFYGVDIDPEAIAWCRHNLPFGTFKSTNPDPPLPFEPKQFDFIYVISVFTHLDEEYQFAWLNELKRIARPGAIVIATAHGSYTHSGLGPEEKQTLSEKGFLFNIGTTGRFKADGLPDFYQTAFHTEEYIRANWGRFFRIRSYIPRGVNSHQDLVVLQNE
jgi:SAM-dependent methyltransferase